MWHSLLDDILRGRYFVRSPDSFGNMLVSRAWGHYPRKNAVFEAITAPIFVGVQSAMVRWTDRVVRKRAHHRKSQEEEEESS